MVEKFPRGNKVPDALLKVAFTYLALGSARPGRETLQELVRNYPRHPASGLAEAKLAELDGNTLQHGARGDRGSEVGRCSDARTARGWSALALAGVASGAGRGPVRRCARRRSALPGSRAPSDEAPLPDIDAIERGATARASVSFGRPNSQEPAAGSEAGAQPGRPAPR